MGRADEEGALLLINAQLWDVKGATFPTPL